MCRCRSRRDDAAAALILTDAFKKQQTIFEPMWASSTANSCGRRWGERRTLGERFWTAIATCGPSSSIGNPSVGTRLVSFTNAGFGSGASSTVPLAPSKAGRRFYALYDKIYRKGALVSS